MTTTQHSRRNVQRFTSNLRFFHKWMITDGPAWSIQPTALQYAAMARYENVCAQIKHRTYFIHSDSRFHFTLIRPSGRTMMQLRWRQYSNIRASLVFLIHSS